MNSNQISKPFRDTNGFCVVKLIKVEPAEVKPFAEVKDEVAKALKQQRLTQEFDKMKLLLCAASARALAQSAKAAGLDFASVDFFGDVDTKEAGANYSLREMGDSYSTENLYKNALKLEFSHVIYGAGFENYPDLVGGFEDIGNVLGNGAKILRRVRDWGNFFSSLEKEKINFQN